MKRLVCFCLVLTGLSALATDWYADADHGNDLWDGTSAAFVSGTTGPKKTLQAALDIEGLKSGDTLWLLPGDGMFAGDTEGTVDGGHPNDFGMMQMADAFGCAVRSALELQLTQARKETNK